MKIGRTKEENSRVTQSISTPASALITEQDHGHRISRYHIPTPPHLDWAGWHRVSLPSRPFSPRDVSDPSKSPRHASNQPMRDSTAPHKQQTGSGRIGMDPRSDRSSRISRRSDTEASPMMEHIEGDFPCESGRSPKRVAKLAAVGKSESTIPAWVSPRNEQLG